MKKYIAIILAVLLIAVPCYPYQILHKAKNLLVYKGTITDLRISAVDGTAFIDNLPYTYSSDFSAGVDGWLSSGGTAVGNIDGIGAENDWIRLTISNASSMHFIYRALLTVGKKYTISIKYYIPSTNSNLNGIKIGDSGTTLSSIFNTLDTVSTATFTFTAGAVGCRFYGLYGSNATFQDAGGDDVFYIKDVKISEIQPFMDGNHQIEIYDSSNRMLKGVLKAAGTGETTGSDLVDTWTNNISSPFETWTPGSGSDITQAVNSTTDGICYKQTTQSAGMLTKTVITNFTKASGANLYYHPGAVSGALASITDGNGWNIASLGAGTYYRTVKLGTYVGFRQDSPDTIDFSLSGFSLKQVLTPSSSGCTLQKSKSDSTESFLYKNPAFVFNAASYYCIVRAIR